MNYDKKNIIFYYTIYYMTLILTRVELKIDGKTLCIL